MLQNNVPMNSLAEEIGIVVVLPWTNSFGRRSTATMMNVDP